MLTGETHDFKLSHYLALCHKSGKDSKCVAFQAQKAPNPVFGRGFAPDPAGELTTFPNPLFDWEGRYSIVPPDGFPPQGPRRLVCSVYSPPFLSRDALCIVQSAVLRSHVVCLSVRLSVRLPVTLVICDHIGWKSWKLIARTISRHLRSLKPKGDSPSPGGTWGNFADNRDGVGKSGVLENISSNISETRKDRGKVTMDDL